MTQTVEAIRWTPFLLELLDQRALPHETVYLRYETASSVAQGIQDMVVRGAPAIGIAAAYGMAIAAHNAVQDGADLTHALRDARAVLAKSRPTAVNLFWALERCEELSIRAKEEGATDEEIRDKLEECARWIHQDDIDRNQAMGRFGAELIPDQANVLTHCNAGALATGGHGTALGVFRSAVDAGKSIHVWVDETRPYLQGARLTLYEMVQEGIPATLISDNMSGFLMSQGKVDAVVVGTDRTVANGDVANKIGTYTLAVLCKRHNIPFYVACPLSTLDLTIATGAEIPIEERSAKELTSLQGVSIAPEGANAYHPAFDVTPAELVTAIITEAGVARPPYSESLVRLLEEGEDRAHRG